MWGFANAYLEAFPELNEGIHRAVSHLPVAHLIERTMSMLSAAGRRRRPAYRRGGRGPAAHALRGAADLPQRGAAHPGKDRVADHHRHPAQLLDQAPAYAGRCASAALPRQALAGQRSRGLALARRCAGLRSRWCSSRCSRRPACRRSAPSSAPARRCPLKIQELWEIWGVNVRNLYGITEGSYVLCQRGAFPPPTRGGAAIYPREIKLGVRWRADGARSRPVPRLLEERRRHARHPDRRLARHRRRRRGQAAPASGASSTARRTS